MGRAGAAHLVSIGRRQVLLIEEPLLQLKDLMIGERRPRLALLLGLLARAEQRVPITAAVTASRLAACNATTERSVITWRFGRVCVVKLTDLALPALKNGIICVMRRAGHAPARKTFSRRAPIRERRALGNGGNSVLKSVN